jgi:diguanylate cyclase (GGDEF)-like protein
MMKVITAKSPVSRQSSTGKAGGKFGPLFDRSLFVDQVRAWLKRPNDKLIRALLYLRPDDFREIDERFGPLVSDELIEDLGQFIADQLSDEVVISRFGGNVFTLLLEKRSISGILAQAEKLCEAIAEHLFETSSFSTNLTVSIGVIELTESVPDEIQAITRAQIAAREARFAGGNRVEVDTSLETSEEDNAEILHMARKIRWALDSNAFRVVYQPMASLSDAANENYDVLVRMRGEDGEELLPGDFFPAAESEGLMPDVDRWIIERALRAAAARWAEGKKTRIFFRVSEASLHDQRFFGWLGLETLKYQLDPDGIVVQVSESVAERNLSLARQLGQTCQDLHYKFSLSNAGVSRNGLKLVEQLPLDYLSIDGSFTKNPRNSSLRMQVHRLISAAKEKGAQIIASRVENATALSHLVNLGIDFVVGYHVHEPEEYMVDDVFLPPASELPDEGDDEDAGWEIEG